MLVIGLTQKVGIASTWPGIICQQFGTVLPCLCNGPYPPSIYLTVNQINTYYVNSKTCVNYAPKVLKTFTELEQLSTLLKLSHFQLGSLTWCNYVLSLTLLSTWSIFHTFSLAHTFLLSINYWQTW